MKVVNWLSFVLIIFLLISYALKQLVGAGHEPTTIVFKEKTQREAKNNKVIQSPKAIKQKSVSVDQDWPYKCDTDFAIGAKYTHELLVETLENDPDDAIAERFCKTDNGNWEAQELSIPFSVIFYYVEVDMSVPGKLVKQGRRTGLPKGYSYPTRTWPRECNTNFSPDHYYKLRKGIRRERGSSMYVYRFCVDEKAEDKNWHGFEEFNMKGHVKKPTIPKLDKKKKDEGLPPWIKPREPRNVWLLNKNP